MSLNEKIKLFNERIFHEQIEIYKSQNEGVAGSRPKSLGYHKYGIRKDTITQKDGTKTGVLSHRFEHWRESSKEMMMHLNDNQRAKMGRALNNFYVYQFEPIQE